GEERHEPVGNRLRDDVEERRLRRLVLGLRELLNEPIPCFRRVRVDGDLERRDAGRDDHAQAEPDCAAPAGVVAACLGRYGSVTLASPAWRASTKRWSSRSRPSLRIRKSM